MNQNILVKDIRSGGGGGEAEIIIQVRNFFPGIGGCIKTVQSAVVALRREYNQSLGLGHNVFLRHLVVKKLDDYFSRLGLYTVSHITRPFGSLSKTDGQNEEAVIYEWACGQDGFPWITYNRENYNEEWITLDEWSAFASAFADAGIDVASDITNPDDGRISQNIVHQLLSYNEEKLNLYWNRIDFGQSSLRINYETLGRFLRNNSVNLEKQLGQHRYELLLLAYKFLAKEKTKEREVGRLDILIRDYRMSTLRHLSPELMLKEML